MRIPMTSDHRFRSDPTSGSDGIRPLREDLMGRAANPLGARQVNRHGVDHEVVQVRAALVGTGACRGWMNRSRLLFRDAPPRVGLAGRSIWPMQTDPKQL